MRNTNVSVHYRTIERIIECYDIVDNAPRDNEKLTRLERDAWINLAALMDECQRILDSNA